MAVFRSWGSVGVHGHKAGARAMPGRGSPFFPRAVAIHSPLIAAVHNEHPAHVHEHEDEDCGAVHTQHAHTHTHTHTHRTRSASRLLG